MGYLKDLYGERGEDFIRGLKAGIEAYAWWKDGTQYVGTAGRTLKEALEEVDKEFGNENQKKAEETNPGRDHY